VPLEAVLRASQLAGEPLHGGASLQLGGRLARMLVPVLLWRTLHCRHHDRVFVRTLTLRRKEKEGHAGPPNSIRAPARDDQYFPSAARTK